MVAAARARVWGLVAAACAGIGLSWSRWPGTDTEVWWWLAGAVVSLLLCLLPARGRVVWWYAGVWMGVFCLAGWWFAVDVKGFAGRGLLANATVAEAAAGRGVVQVRGMVEEIQQVRGGDAARGGAGRGAGLEQFLVREAASRLMLRVEQIAERENATDASERLRWTVISGRLAVYVGSAGKETSGVRAGDWVEVVGRFSPVQAPRNPGETDRRPLLWDRGECGSLRASSWGVVQPIAAPTQLGARASAWLAHGQAGLRERAKSVVVNAAGEDRQTQSVLLGLLLGVAEEGSEEVYGAFVRQGLVHILSISGFHLGVMAAFTLAFLRLTGDRGWLEPVVVGALVLVYAAVVPAQSPVLRSAAMVLLLLAAEAVGRRYDHLTLLGWITIGLLAWRPSELASLGFQLSVGLTALLFWLADGCTRSLFPPLLRGTIRYRERRVGDGLMASLKGCTAANILCWTASLPLLIVRTGIVSPAAIIAGLVLTPVFIVLLWCGYGALMAGLLVPGLEGWASGVLGWLTRVAIGAVQVLDAVPGTSVRVPPTPWWWGAGATTFILAAMWWGWAAARPAPALTGGVILIPTSQAGWWRRWGWLAVAVGWLGMLPLIWTVNRGLAPGVVLRIDMLDVGDGTCHIVRGADGGAVLWDCGSLRSGGTGRTIARAARSLGVFRTPTAVITHPDIDHFVGLLDVCEPLGIERVLMPRRMLEQASAQPAGAAGLAVMELRSRGISIEAVERGSSWEGAGLAWKVLSPEPDASWSEDNEHSIVARLDPAGAGAEPDSAARALAVLTGDIGPLAIENISYHFRDLRTRVVEVPHHGSVHPAAIAFVRDLEPDVALQSTGRGRVGNRRWKEVAEAAQAWLATAEVGAAWVEVMDDGTVRWGGYLDK